MTTDNPNSNCEPMSQPLGFQTNQKKTPRSDLPVRLCQRSPII